ncbi:DUF4159 domain-containing protein [Planctomycetales bacterium ZRK34]|nr:DUF4159 domain-containing protein [Planctomycetales bacterium ZRK34]
MKVRRLDNVVRRGLWVLVLALVPACLLYAADIKDVCGPPPPPAPTNASSAEGLPPLPLPAVPQRRSEKKLPPRPPVIAVKIMTGTMEDWATDMNDINNLLIWMKANLGVNFTYDEKKLEEVDLESGQVPVIYRTGHHAFSFTPEQRERIRNYVLRGGMIIFDSCCGSKEFASSARNEIKQILPDYPMRPVPVDHPIFNCYYENVGTVRFTPWSLKQDAGLSRTGPSGIMGVEVNCRMAIVFSPNDLSCGWDMHTHEKAGGTWIESDDALKIGANLMAYATATRDMSTSLADAKAYVDATTTRSDKFVVGQMVHKGDWNPDPVGLRNLLDYVSTNTALKISFENEPVQPTLDVLTKHPFVYMTGHDDFVWTDAEVAAIRQWLSNGGFLFVDACCGRQKFDAAFRREIAKVLEPAGVQLGRLPLKHPLYSCENKVTSVQMTDAARLKNPGQDQSLPKLEGAAMGGRIAVVYSPISLNVGWRVHPVPYSVSYSPRSALDLGVNVVIYAMTN